ncbi:MAG: cation transporter [Clostridia bacterium]|nr:cation transporter [Clostridia bacterium]
MLIRFLTKSFIKDAENITAPSVRSAYGVFGGILGIICNIVLFVLKLTIGTLVNSIAIVSDAFNNLSDMGSSIVAMIGAKLSNQRPDEEHPFGHGRFEYISSLIVSFIIITMGFELVKSSFHKILNPVRPEFNIMLLTILGVSVLIKLWMFFAVKFLGKKINSDVLLATSSDSLNDAIATTVILLSVVLCNFLPPVIDGIAGTAVAIMICISGIKLAWETIGTLLGTSPDPIVAEKIAEIILSDNEILGIHDLIVHDYGPGRTLASVHAEVSCEKSAIMLHEIIDALEMRIMEELGIETVIHTDPILVSNDKVNETREMVKNIIAEINSELGMHDFRMTDGETRINLIFDLEVPFELTDDERKETLSMIKKNITTQDERFACVIKVDNKPSYSIPKK